MAMTLIERINVTGSSNLSYTFSNIPQTYTDLLVISTNQSAGTASDVMTIAFNGDTTMANYDVMLWRYTQSIGTDGTWVGDNNFSALSLGQTTYPSFAAGTTIYIPNYTSSSTAKSANCKTGSSGNASAAASQIGIYGVQWTGTSAITSITFSGYGLYPTTGSTFSLYGVS